VLRRLRFALSPGWLVLHLIALALIVTMVLLGSWQLNVSNAKHFSLQNFGYALQWWAFSIFVLAMWARILRDTGQRSRGHETPASQAYGAGRLPDPESAESADQPVAYRRYVMPQSGSVQAPSADPEHAAYNDYLARLDAKSSETTRTIRAEGTTP
jgi:DNA-binding transcriptional regulator of glucitol operon